MMIREQIDTFIELLQRHELAIADLYDKFGDLFPRSNKSWQAFADEERRHAKWIGALHAHLNDGTVSFEETHMTIQSTRIAIEYIERQIEGLEKKHIDLSKALAMAVDIEKSLMESAFFRIFKLSAPKGEAIRSRLMAETENHIKRLADWQKKIKDAADPVDLL